MKWISVYEGLPRLYEVVWVYWEGKDVVLGCRTNAESDPDWGWYSFPDGEIKYASYWFPVRHYSLEKPKPPRDEE